MKQNEQLYLRIINGKVFHETMNYFSYNPTGLCGISIRNAPYIAYADNPAYPMNHPICKKCAKIAERMTK